MKTELVILALTISVQIATSYPDHYVLVQRWPTSFCSSNYNRDVNMTRFGGSDQCAFAKNITGWTVGGLRPLDNGFYPTYCNNSWTLHPNSISDLVDNMRAVWPSLTVSRDDFGLWSNEWLKYGTCAANTPELHGPNNYFSTAMKLSQHYNGLKMFEMQGIVPGYDRHGCYPYSRLRRAAHSVFNQNVILGCVRALHTNLQVLAQIEICLDKQFNLNCSPASRKGVLNYFDTGLKDMPPIEPCHNGQEICYRPIPH